MKVKKITLAPLGPESGIITCPKHGVTLIKKCMLRCKNLKKCEMFSFRRADVLLDHIASGFRADEQILWNKRRTQLKIKYKGHLKLVIEGESFARVINLTRSKIKHLLNTIIEFYAKDGKVKIYTLATPMSLSAVIQHLADEH